MWKRLSGRQIRGYKSRQWNARKLSNWAAVAQLVEHIIRNDGVGGSNPFSGTTFTFKIIQ